MRVSHHDSEYEGWSDMGDHEKFLELCALSATGELTEKEQREFQAHVATCSDCRRAVSEFEAAAVIGMPLLRSQLSDLDSCGDGRFGLGTRSQVDTHLGLRNRSDSRGTHVSRNLAWMSAAAVLVVSTALTIFAFHLAKQRPQPVVSSEPNSAGGRVQELEAQISDLGHDREVLMAELAHRDRLIAGLRRQVTVQLTALAEAKNSEARLEKSLESDQVQQQEVLQQRRAALEKLDTVQASLQKSQVELDSLHQQRSHDEARAEDMEAQIRDLHSQLRYREQQVDEQGELLAHDRDIRELMGARELYIAEVYDVARDGETQRPYGRVFYTKGKSLVFYAYDLDRQESLQNAADFQVWGRRNGDRLQPLNLGIFYQDSAAKKRWVLKLDDPEIVAKIDSVFVTVEPRGGSQKPTGKQLLFASLTVQPNHP